MRDRVVMRIEQFEAAEATSEQLQAWHEVDAAALTHDLPGWPVATVAELRLRARAPRYPGEQNLVWLASADAPLGLMTLDLLPAPNTDAAFLRVTVVPEHRRRGLGRRLARTGLAELRRHGRAKVWAEAAEGGPGGAFARAIGFPGSDDREPMSLLRLDPARRQEWEKLSEPAEGYRLAHWNGGVPAEFVDSYAAAKRAMQDAPTGETGWQTVPWDADRWRQNEEHWRRAGREMQIVAALAADGTVAGLTEVLINTFSRQRAAQEDTVVVPGHRGHGLGLAMKATMLGVLLREHPEVREVGTWNAEENRYMRAINERLGFAIDTWWVIFTGATADLLA